MPAGRSRPDGLALDEAGTLYVAHASHGMVNAYDEGGHPTLTVDCRAFGKTVTNLAFGGPERRQLYITVSDSGTIAVADMPVPGRPLSD
ncbi:MAG: SMP-30/gluconolactonase/LRE family protein [Pseudomonadota bacterium]